MTRGNPLKFGMTVSTSTWVISSGIRGRNAAALLPSEVLIIVRLHGMYIVYIAYTLSAHYISHAFLGANEVCIDNTYLPNRCLAVGYHC